MTAKRKILELNAFDMDAAEDLDPGVAALVARRKRVFGPTSMLFYARPLNLVRGEDVWLIGADGTRYLDAYNNVASVGHCHPRVVAAVSRQMATLTTHTRYLSEIVYTYAERLLATFPRGVSNIVFTCTGSESVDLSLRIAREVTGGTGFIVTANAYHGNTLAVNDISPASASAAPRSPNVFIVPAPDTYRTTSKDVGANFAAQVKKAIAAMKRKKIRLAGLVADSLFSSDGIYPGEPGFLAEAIAHVRKAGGVFIADEVQPGFGRTGETMWGFARHGLDPDMVAMGKPMGNGYPIGGVAVKPDLLATFGATTGYFNTFGGNPVAAAAGLAVLETIEAETLQQNARDTGAYLLAALGGVAQRFACVGDVRGAGLYLGVELVRDRKSKTPDREAATRIVDMLRDRNVLVGIAGPYGNVIKIRPPLTFTREHADVLVTALTDSLASLA
jgi:4-aminobutyrate aminotransferase-like enzyme